MTGTPPSFAGTPERQHLSGRLAAHWRFHSEAAMQRPQRHAETAFAPDFFRKHARHEL